MRRTLVLLFLLSFLLAAALGAAAGKGDDGGADGGRGGRGEGGDRDGRDDLDDRDVRRGGDKDDDGDDDDRDGDEDDGEDGDDEDDDREGRRDRHKHRDGDGRERSRDEVQVELTGDAVVHQKVQNEPGRLGYLLLVGDVGAGVAQAVRLDAELPDLGGDWSLAGAGSQACGIAGFHLACSFGDLRPGEVRLLQLTSKVGSAPPWEVRTTADVVAGNDARPDNDSATTVVGILLT